MTRLCCANAVQEGNLPAGVAEVVLSLARHDQALTLDSCRLMAAAEPLPIRDDGDRSQGSRIQWIRRKAKNGRNML